MPRRLFWLTLPVLLIAAIAAAGAAALVYRAPLLEGALEIYLARLGYPQASLTVAEFTAERIVAEDVSLGPGAPSAARVTAVSYLKLLQNEDRWRLEIDSLRVPVDLAQEGGPGLGVRLAQTAAFLHDYRDWLPILDLRDARVTLRGEGARELTMAADLVTRVDWPSLGFWLKGRVESEGTGATIELRSGGSAALPGMRLEAQGRSDLAKLPWPAGLPAPAAGTAAFKIESLLPLPNLAETAAQAFARFPATAKLDLELAGVSLPGRAQALSGKLALEAEGTPEHIRLSLETPAEMTAAALDLPELSALGPAGAALAGLLARGAKLAVAAADKAPLLALARVNEGWAQDIRAQAKLTAANAAASAKLAAKLRSDLLFWPQELKSAAVDIEASRIPLGVALVEKLAWKTSATMARGAIAAAGPLELRVSKLRGFEENAVSYSGAVKLSGSLQDLSLEQQKPGSLAVTGLEHFGNVQLDRPLKAAVSSARLRRTAQAVEIEIAAHPESLAGRIARADAPAVPFAAEAAALGLKARIAEKIGGELALDDAAVRFPAAQVAVEGISARLPFAVDAEAPPGRLAAAIRSLAVPALFDPIEAELEVTQKKDAVIAVGVMKLAEGKAETPVAARYEKASGSGEMRIGPAAFAFKPGHLQPGDLNPRLAELHKAEGALRVDGNFAYGPETGLTSGGQVAFDNLTFETAGVRIEKLNGVLDLLDLLAPRTAPGQALTAAHIVAGAALDDVEVDFSLAAEETGAVVAIDEASARLAEGDLRVPGTTVRLAAESNAATVRVKSVSLARLLESLGTDNVTGTGILSGSIPLRFGRAGFAVENGTLKAESEGVLHVRLGSAKQTLEAQGEAMRLMVAALEDFRYTVFEIEVDRPPGADLSLKIRLEGMNPAVLEGHPFRFNISLTGDVEPLMAALRAGQGLTADILERAVDVGR